MIEAIRVGSLALIKECEMRFSGGMTVLTGETGAGKTALLGAIKLAIGARADAAAVREGEDGALVEAVFTCDTRAAEALAESGLPVDGDIILVRRRVSASGHSRCYVNDAMTTVGTLSSVVGRMVDLHGQHEHQSLLSPSNHLSYLDRWAGDDLTPLLDAYREALAAYRANAVELERARESERMSGYRIEQAQFVCDQIGAISPGESEHEELEAILPVLRNGESLAEASGEALGTIRSDGGVLDMMQSLLDSLRRASGTDSRLDAIAERAESVVLDLEDLAMELRSYRDSVEFDPDALRRALDRLGDLDGLIRRFGPTYSDVLSVWRESKEILESAVDAPGRIAELEARLERDRAELESAAGALDSFRMEAAASLSEELSRSAAELAMPGASFSFRHEKLDLASWDASGSSRYELMYAPSASMTPRPLARIASGGELSRVMLALETVIDDGDPSKTLVFDEVDAGIGGATAQTVASRLRDLGGTHQVIVVTHLAQIAAVADAHLLVEKEAGDGMPVTVIREISGQERVREISRMLSGTVDEASLEHARSMLEGAAGSSEANPR